MPEARSSFNSLLSNLYNLHRLIMVNNKETYYKINELTSAQCCVPYRNQSFVLHSKTNDWFLYGA